MPSSKKIALLSNVTADLIAAKLRGKYDIYLPAGFDTWIQETINKESGLYKRGVEAVIVLLDGTESRTWKDDNEAQGRISLWEQAVTALAGGELSVPVFLTTIDFRLNRITSYSERSRRTEYANCWYQFIQGLAEKNDNIYVIDLADAIADIGRERFYSNKMWYMGSMPYSRDGLDVVCREISWALDASFSARKKIIALDLDDTLWGGIVGDDGVDGIELSDHKEGQRYYDFQRQLLEMKNRGIVLAIDSKNNEADAEAAIQGHPYMLLRDDDFVSKKINWENKAFNIKAIERELNLTESGFIFIDDNAAEREIVRGICPEAAVPEFPGESAELLPFAERIWFDYCRPLKVLGEDADKTLMYQGEAVRQHVLRASINLDDYIARLEMVADIHRMRPDELNRVAQLVIKTNQFNLTTRRYMRSEIEEIAERQGWDIYVVYASDKYGDSGLVGAVILADEGAYVRIDSLLMSCRVMGRKLEDVIMNELAKRYFGRNLTGEYIPTEKNAPVRDLYERLGFEVVACENGHSYYCLDTKKYIRKDVSCYKEIKFKG